MNQTTAVVLAAVVGAGGAVLAQIVTATFEQRAANRRLAWERGGRFADVQRLLFAHLLNAHWQFLRECLAGDRDVEQDYSVNLQSTGTLVNEIALLAPDLAAVVGALEAAAALTYEAVGEAAGPPRPGDTEAYAMTEDYRATIEVCREEMAKQLSGAT